MMALALVGVVLRGVEETFKMKEKSETMLQAVVKQEELYKSLATRQHDFAPFFEADPDSDCEYEGDKQKIKNRQNGYIPYTSDMYFAAMNYFLEQYDEERHRANTALLSRSAKIGLKSRLKSFIDKKQLRFGQQDQIPQQDRYSQPVGSPRTGNPEDASAR
jgi:hypothetical protein